MRMSVTTMMVVLFPVLAWGQPMPVPGTGQDGTILDDQGHGYQRFTTPSGSVVYDAQSRSWTTFNTPDGGSVTYDNTGHSSRVFPPPGEETRRKE